MTDPKVTSEHLQREAYLYVRQSTLQQVIENTESTERQYALRHRARMLGWGEDQIVVVDDDQGLSGASAMERKGFQHLVAEVGLGRVGLVMGLEVSRLARNNADWHRLLEICALTDTLILDEDGLYDPGHFNDRLLLGLKGTMSEAELHILRARLQGGLLNKARRGELRIPLPVGLVYDGADKVILDPDQQVRGAVGCLFATFQRTGSAFAVARHFRENGLLFPGRVPYGPRPGKMVWTPLTPQRAIRVLHNPRYAGAFVFGATRTRKNPVDGTRRTRKVPKNEWTVFLPESHEGYISWKRYEQNQRQLASNAAAHGADRRHGPPRSGPALLQGIVLCGKCGGRMTVNYHTRGTTRAPTYICQREMIEHRPQAYHIVPGALVDEAIGRLLVEMVTPASLDVTMQVFDEIRKRREEVVQLHRARLERAHHEAELAQHRFLLVDPGNRLVAEDLERRWNDALRAVASIEEECARVASEQTSDLTAEETERIRELAEDFPAVWSDPLTTPRERKRMVRLLIEDVTLLKADEIHLMVRFKGGATTEVRVPAPLPVWQVLRTPSAVLERIREMARTMTDSEIAEGLNAEGLRSGTRLPFSSRMLNRLRHQYGIPGPYEHMRKQGFLTTKEVAERRDVRPETVKRWQGAGLLKVHRYNDRGNVLYEDMREDFPVKWAKQRGTEVRFVVGNIMDSSDGVQYDA